MFYGRLNSGRPPRVSALSVSLALLGFCVAHGSPAEAGAVTVNPVQTTTYTLDPANNPITFGPQTDIEVSNDNGVSGFSAAWILTNKGTIRGGATSDGIFISQSTIVNAGSISGGFGGATIVFGGAITNKATGTISASRGVGAAILGKGQLTNFGLLSGNTGAFVDIGSLVNEPGATIQGVGSAAAGVSVNSATITNSGLITATQDGVMMGQDQATATASLVNKAGGQISGGLYGVLSFDLTSTKITNAGRINGNEAVIAYKSSLSLTNSGTIQGIDGVLMREGGKLTNQSGGTISGSTVGVGDSGVYDSAADAGIASTIVNQSGGTIQGSNAAISFGQNAGPTTLTNAGTITSPGFAVQIAGGAINNLAGGVISSGLGGGQRAITAPAGSVTVTNAGTIIGMVFVGGGGTITNTKTGLISGPIYSAATPITFSNAGTWQLHALNGAFVSSGGSITNTGLIEGGPGQTLPQQYEIYGAAAFHNGSSSTAGMINLSNGIVGDVLLLDQPFAAATGHSVLTLDAFLGGPGSQADQLQLTAGSSGQTLIRINNTNTGPGALNSSGIVLVTGATAANNFALDPKGPGYNRKDKGIVDGLFLYSLQFQSGNEVLVGTAAPAAHQLATAQTAGQTILSAASFSPSDGASSGAGFAGFTGDGSANLERPMFWTAAVNTLSPDPKTQGAFVGAPGGSRIAPPPSLRLSAMQSSAGMDTGYDQGLAMLKGGVDLVRRRDGDRSFSLGVGTAYIQSDQRFTDGGAAMFYSGVVYGGYADWRSGSAYLSAAFKSAMLKAQYQASWLPNSNPSAGLTATGVQIDGGFSYDLGPGWRLEPVASMAASRTSMSDLRIGGELARFSAGYTGWANAGARLEGTTRFGGYQLDSRFTARVWDRFGDSTAWLASLGSNSPLIDRISGVSGELAAELRLSAGRNLFGFVQTSARTGAAQTAAMALAGLSLRW